MTISLCSQPLRLNWHQTFLMLINSSMIGPIFRPFLRAYRPWLFSPYVMLAYLYLYMFIIQWPIFIRTHHLSLAKEMSCHCWIVVKDQVVHLETSSCISFFLSDVASDTSSLNHCQVGSVLCKYSGDNRQNTEPDQMGRVCLGIRPIVHGRQKTEEVFRLCMNNLNWRSISLTFRNEKEKRLFFKQ